ncbi:MAG: tRNA 2-thiouridine(34) synthase MnmA [Candidatus Dasytiphilus stammeri]
MYLNKNKKIIIGMSGGVDSSVAALLLKKQKYQVEAVFMKNWEEDDNEIYCQSKKDLLDAEQVCNKLGIILHKVNFSAEYWEKVFQYFLSEYKSGRTPNPDIICNKEIKFRIFRDFAFEDLGADFIATGHYVRLLEMNNQKFLLRGIDITKDQSYFLHILRQEQLQRTIFPLGDMTKVIVRNIAKEAELITAEKKDSTGICFIGKKKFLNFLKLYLPEQPGNIINTNGNIIGQHVGIMFYTIGQRKGLGIGSIKNSNSNEPWYVVDKNIENNLLIVAQGHKNPKLMSTSLIATHFHWINNSKPPSNKKIFCTVKTRHHQDDIPCIIMPPHNRNSILVKFMTPVAAITPGQSAVFYWGDLCLGGCVIKKSLN